MRCLTILLTCGWLLFSPPLSKDGKHFDTSQSLSLWEHIALFDTAKECEQTKAKALMSLPTLQKADKKESLDAYTRKMTIGAALGRCLPSDNLTLKKKEG